MQNVTLIKHHSSVQLAHLYEHLFLMDANELLNGRGLFKWLDFTLNGTTYEQGGIVAIEFKTYNDQAKECIADLSNLKPNFSGLRVNKALMQLHAEEYYQLKASNIEVITKELKAMDDMKWESLDELKVIDTHSMQRKQAPLHATRQADDQPITTMVSLEVDPQVVEADPLALAIFTIASRMILLTANYKIVTKTGSYSWHLYAQLSGKRVSVDVLTAARFRKYKPDLEQTGKMVQDVFGGMHFSGAFDRLVNELHNTSYDNGALKAPDYEQLLNDTGILVGSEGWKSVTKDAIYKVLNYTDVVIKRGQRIVRVPLVGSEDRL
jgi:hypothetical protein